MDTEQAIQILQTESQNLGVEVMVKTNLQKAIDLATEQLQGVLATQLSDLDAARARIAALEKPADTPKDPPVEDPAFP